MTTTDQMTPEEEAYMRLHKVSWEELSETARTLFEEARIAACRKNIVHSIFFGPQEYEDAMEKLRLAATELTGRDRELLAKLWRAALAAAASIDPDDRTPTRYGGVYRGDLHWFYRMTSSMVEITLQEKEYAELQKKIAEWEWEDPSDPPF